MMKEKVLGKAEYKINTGTELKLKTCSSMEIIIPELFRNSPVVVKKKHPENDEVPCFRAFSVKAINLPAFFQTVHIKARLQHSFPVWQDLILNRWSQKKQVNPYAISQ